MAKFFKGNSERAEILEIEESSAKFSFSGRGDNGRDDGAMDINGTIDGRQWIIGRWWLIGNSQMISEIVETASLGAGFQFTEIGGIAVGGKLHVTGVEAEDGIWMCGAVVEELGDSMGSCFGAF
jgi:hypothetical protein